MHTEETKQYLREINTGEKNPMFLKGKERVGDKNPFFGKTHSEESKKKIGESKQGAKHPKARKIIDKNGKTWDTLKDAAEELGIKSNHFCNMLNGKEPWYKRLKDLELKYLD